MTRKITEYLSEKSKQFIIISCILLVILMGFFDYITGRELSFSIFYLLPIIIVTRYAGRTPGIVLAFLSGFSWFIGDLILGHKYIVFFAPYWNLSASIVTYIIIVTMMNALRVSLENEWSLARIDSLTNVANVRHFFEISRSELSKAQRFNRPLTLGYIDIDNFKDINDEFGHNIGDQLLYTVAQTIKLTIRDMDHIFRIGGDEFVILLPETNQEAAKAVFSRIEKDLMKVMGSNNWLVTFSVGVVTFITLPATVDEMLKMADESMYQVKKGSKNAITYILFKQPQKS